VALLFLSSHSHTALDLHMQVSDSDTPGKEERDIEVSVSLIYCNPHDAFSNTSTARLTHTVIFT